MKKRAIPTVGGVHNPATGRLLPKSGAVVEVDSYWARRERDGSVTLQDIPAAPAQQSRAAVEGGGPSAKGPAKKSK